MQTQIFNLLLIIPILNIILCFIVTATLNKIPYYNLTQVWWFAFIYIFIHPPMQTPLPLEPSSYISDFFNMDLHNGYNMFKMAAVCLIGWTYFFFMVQWLVHFPKLDLKSNNDIKNRIVSIVHGLTTFVLSIKCLFFTEYDYDGPNTQLQNFLMIVSMSYVIYDLVACYFYNLFGIGLFVHHTTCIIGYLSALMSGHGAALAIAGLFYAEVSNFPMHARVICRDFSIRYSKTYELSQNLYLISYVIARGFFCPFVLVYPSLMCKNIPWVVTIMCNLLIIQSLYYITQMYEITLKKLKQYKQMKEKKVEYFWFSVNPEIEKLSFVKKEEKQKIF